MGTGANNATCGRPMLHQVVTLVRDQLPAACDATARRSALPCPVRPSFVTWTRPRPATNGNLQVNRPAAGPPLNTVLPTTCYAQYRYASFWRYVRPRAAPWTPGAQIVPRPRPPAAPARTRRRSGGRVCAAWSGTVGAGARGRGPGWHGARPRHMSRTRPCGGWVDSPLAERCACAAPFYSLALLRCPSRRPLPCPACIRPGPVSAPCTRRQGRGCCWVATARPPAALVPWPPWPVHRSACCPTICSPARTPTTRALCRRPAAPRSIPILAPSQNDFDCSCEPHEQFRSIHR
jgi:hypothetical protein